MQWRRGVNLFFRGELYIEKYLFNLKPFAEGKSVAMSLQFVARNALPRHAAAAALSHVSFPADSLSYRE